jgi:GH15 family glucan-1,4-alpha-glucosidase
VQSKAMCWAALDRGLRLLEDLRCGGPVGEWTRARDAIRAAIERYGYDPERGVFIQAFGCADLDAALLLLPTVGFVDFSDERMIRTTDAIRDALSENGLLRRYPAGNDGLEGREGVFLPCSFWLVECLARQGRLAEAHEVLRRALSTSNELGLFSEEYDTGTGEMLGNFPQGLTHLSLISATVALAAMEKPSPPERERSEEKRY